MDWLAARARATPDKPFLHIPPARLNFAEVHQRVQATCDWILADSKITAGDRVGILMPPGLPYVLSVLALMRIGAVAVPLNSRLTASELKWQLQNTACRLLLCQPATAALAPDGDVLVFAKMPRQAKAAQDDPPPIDLNADFAIIHTSGTSGRPKAAVLTYNNIYQSAMASAYRLGVLPDDRWLCVLPLYHVGGLSILMRSLLYGTAVELLPAPRFDAAAVNRLLTEQAIALVSLVPTMLQRLLDAKTAAWHPKLRLILLGGEAPSAALLERCARDEIPVAATYGLSEAASQVTTASPELTRQKPASSGKPLLFTQVRIVDARGQAVPAGQIGEVLVKGPTVMRAYDRNPRATQAALRDGWLFTGDMGYLDADGDLHIVQRRVDLILSGGENIYPREVETVLCRHPAVCQAVVVGLPDAQWGQRVAAAIQLAAGKTASAEEIIHFARAELAGYKIPRTIRFVDAFPRSASGKIQRQQVKRGFIADAGQGS